MTGGVRAVCGLSWLVFPLLVWVLPNPGAASIVDLGLQVARVSANEGAFVYRSTTPLVWQVARSNARELTEESIAEFLARHSPRVHGTRPCLGGNCLWSPHLTRDGVQPAGLDLRADIWAIKVAPIWLDTLRYADYLVRGFRRDADPCRIQPRTWGGPMDRQKAIARGLYPIGCDGGAGCTRDSCNDGYTFYARCWVDGVWACDPHEEPAVQSVEPAEQLWSSL